MTKNSPTVNPETEEKTEATVQIENEEVIKEQEETPSVQEELPEEETPAEAEPTENAVEGKNCPELLEYMASLIDSEPVQNLKLRIEAVKVSFYKQLHAIQDEARKAFFEANGEDAEYTPEQNELEVKFKDLYRRYRTLRDAFIADSDKMKEENLKKKQEIIEKLKALVESQETLNTTFNQFRALQAEWRETGPVPQQNMKDIWETYNLHVERFYDYVKINKDLRDLDLKKNLEAKTAMCEEAEALAQETSIVEAFHKLQKLHDEWRETGPVTAEFKEPLWERFKAASAVINKRHQEHFESIKAEQTENLSRKEALCEQAEALSDAIERTTLKAWNKASEKLQDLQTQWRTIGFAPKKDNQKVYDRFRAACSKFFDEKRKFYSGLKEDMDKNLRLKEELCEAVEQLQESEEWKTATEKILELQAKWKEIGAVSRRQSDAIWKRFRAACDRFFERKSQHFATQDSEYTSNLEKKNSLISEMEQASAKAGGYDLIKEFQKKWSEIGFVPIKEKEALQKKYKAQLDRLFSELRSSGEGAAARFRDKVSSLRQGGESKIRSEREKLYNKVRQLEQEISQQENNILFFAKSKGAEAMIASVKEKIEKARREMEEAIEKVRIIDSQDEKKEE